MKLNWVYILCCFLIVFVALGVTSFSIMFFKSGDDEYIQQYIVVFKDQLDRGGALQKTIGCIQHHSSIIKHLKEKTQSQVAVVNYLKSKNALIESYWIINALYVETTPDVIAEIFKYPQVDIVYENYSIELISPIREALTDSGLPNLPDNFQVVNVREAWEKGYTGKGRIVCNIDTGVEGRHDALKNSWRGNNGASVEESWFDPIYSDSLIPYDTKGHGTHTMGIMVGKTASETLGVAPDAQWIAAASVDRIYDVEQTIKDILDAFQWVADPDGNSNTIDDVPDVVSNSWGVPIGVRPSCDATFWEVIDNVEACGVVVVFAVGNEGPNSATLRTPADRNTSEINTFSVGALNTAKKDILDIAYFSSRGPSLCDSVTVKPEICAPGMYVRSSYKGNTYINLSGTSMATPFVAGAVALLRQCKPDATVEEIKYVLLQSAKDFGVRGNDNTFGYGILDIAKAISILDPTCISDTLSDGDNEDVPTMFYLYQNYPNPFNISTTITFDVILRTKVTLNVYNVKGQLVRSLLYHQVVEPGFYSIVWKGTNDEGVVVANGIYLYQLRSDNFVNTKKMVFLK